MALIRILFLYALIVYPLSQCNNDNKKLPTDTKQLQREALPILKNNIDTTPIVVEGFDNSYMEELNKFIQTYSINLKLDTILVIDTFKKRIKLNYFCLKDSAIKIPKKYCWDEEKKVLVTHNFNIKLEIYDYPSSHLVFSEIINKEYLNTKFTSFDKDIQQYGVIMNPKFVFPKGILQVNFDYAIPITDRGEPVKLLWDSKKNALY